MMGALSRGSSAVRVVALASGGRWFGLCAALWLAAAGGGCAFHAQGHSEFGDAGGDAPDDGGLTADAPVNNDSRGHGTGGRDGGGGGSGTTGTPVCPSSCPTGQVCCPATATNGCAASASAC